MHSSDCVDEVRLVPLVSEDPFAIEDYTLAAGTEAIMVCMEVRYIRKTDIY